MPLAQRTRSLSTHGGDDSVLGDGDELPVPATQKLKFKNTGLRVTWAKVARRITTGKGFNRHIEGKDGEGCAYTDFM